jgi:hypothetical protein
MRISPNLLNKLITITIPIYKQGNFSWKYSSNKRCAYSKMIRKNAKRNCQIIHFHEKSVFQFCNRAVLTCTETVAP